MLVPIYVFYLFWKIRSLEPEEPSSPTQKHKLIIISGLSGSGKTTLAKALTLKLNSTDQREVRFAKQRSIDQREGQDPSDLRVAKQRSTFVDQDDFYFESKPKVRLSNGMNVSNWDVENSLNLFALRQRLLQLLENVDVVLSAFAPLDNWLGTRELEWKGHTIDHIHLSMAEPGKSYMEYSKLIIKRCIEARIASKRLTTPKQKEKDELMVREIVYPAYRENFGFYSIDYTINVFDDEGKRRPVEKLIEIVMAFFD